MFDYIEIIRNIDLSAFGWEMLIERHMYRKLVRKVENQQGSIILAISLYSLLEHTEPYVAQCTFKRSMLDLWYRYINISLVMVDMLMLDINKELLKREESIPDSVLENFSIRSNVVNTERIHTMTDEQIENLAHAIATILILNEKEIIDSQQINDERLKSTLSKSDNWFNETERQFSGLQKMWGRYDVNESYNVIKSGEIQKQNARHLLFKKRTDEPVLDSILCGQHTRKNVEGCQTSTREPDSNDERIEEINQLNIWKETNKLLKIKVFDDQNGWASLQIKGLRFIGLIIALYAVLQVNMPINVDWLHGIVVGILVIIYYAFMWGNYNKYRKIKKVAITRTQDIPETVSDQVADDTTHRVSIDMPTDTNVRAPLLQQTANTSEIVESSLSTPLQDTSRRPQRVLTPQDNTASRRLNL